ncbi:YggT family protein [Dyella sp. A6]|uniref:YggT family protein n=1 Tax=Dyella aluminiiresistens TaxID=3069105 RepID=UPI002E7913EC|nr:YggT family protein [Dyella sp. A6]
MSYLLNAVALLITLAFNAAVTLFVLRLVAEACRVDFNNPLSQFIYRTTNPVLAPVRRVLPNWRRINIAAVLIAWLLMVLKWLVIFALQGLMPRPAGLLLLSLADLIDFVLMFYLIVVFVWSLFSMLSNDPYHPLQRLLGTIVEPLVRPLRGRLTIGMLDFSPTVIIIGLLLARILISQPISDLGMRLAMGG